MSAEKIKSKIRSIPDIPKKGVIFRDITTLMRDPEGLQLVVDEFVNRYKDMDIDIIAGIEARGFIIGAPVAYSMKKGFITVRKSGKLPYKTISYQYDLEYGTDTLEIHIDAVKKGTKVLLLDDLLATGGTSLAAANLIESLGAKVVELGYIVDLPDLGGRKRVAGGKYDIFTICEFEGE